MASLDANADEIRALLDLVQRAPMTRAEALFTEALFNRWLAVIAAAADVLAAGGQNQPPPISTSDQPCQPVPAGAPLMAHIDQVQST